ncbi:hypothetical protein PP564_06220 [Mycobacteroides abscessus]|uniref:hypothetical protein n=1 Tax=Mycobacteroides abscessus TaxID=36809 RepID=UPI000C257567|nr:hypothetical protein [Mycobacteroides abscessus]MDM2495329.1 hypothetical protein [Mycobacteroides abscessus]MDM2515494.1 hypothetical protein [Mycobacteroides abscessus]MDM2522258.1 hypothetical protein [Mycobacteroides abscessus]MDM2527609.1 hypothetical protein [Mycobacteroides abscessus]MDM2532205.1 hypothetical protein [Mycobacteroides abscessus]
MIRALATMTAAVLLCSGCGTSRETPSTESGTPSPALAVEISIKGGVVTPTNAALSARVSEPILVHVDSDAADELHVHSIPDHSFDIEPKSGQTFQFTVNVPGKVDVELHKLKKTVATITVQP